MAYKPKKIVRTIDTNTLLCGHSQYVFADSDVEIDVDLTAVPEEGQRVTVRNIGTAIVNVDPNGNELDGSVNPVEVAAGGTLDLHFSTDLEWRTLI